MPPKADSTTSDEQQQQTAPTSRGRSQSPDQQQRNRSRSPLNRPQQQRQQQPQRGDVNPGNNLYVTALSHSVKEDALEEVFSRYGRVSSCQIVLDPHERLSRGFAFVSMSSPEQAEAAIEALNGYELDGRKMIVQKARRARPRSPTPGEYRGLPKEERSRPRGVRPTGYRQPYGAPPAARDYYAAPPRRDYYERPPPMMAQYGVPPPMYDPYGMPMQQYDPYGRPPMPRQPYEVRPPYDMQGRPPYDPNQQPYSVLPQQRPPPAAQYGPIDGNIPFGALQQRPPARGSPPY